MRSIRRSDHTIRQKKRANEPKTDQKASGDAHTRPPDASRSASCRGWLEAERWLREAAALVWLYEEKLLDREAFFEEAKELARQAESWLSGRESLGQENGAAAEEEGLMNAGPATNPQGRAD